MKKILLFALTIFFIQPTFGQNDFDCSISDCTCELTVVVQSNQNQPNFDILFGVFNVGPCFNFTQPGTYNIVVDSDNNGAPFSVGLLLVDAVNNDLIQISVTGCGVNEQITMGIENPPLQTFPVFQSCHDNCISLNDNCPNVQFDYCDDGTLTASFTGVVHYVKIFENGNWLSGDFLCSRWGAQPCTGTLTTQLDPSQTHFIQLVGGTIGNEWDQYPPGTALCGDENITIPAFTQRIQLPSNGHQINKATKKQIDVFPNPTNSELNIANMMEVNASVEIYNPNGQLMMVRTLGEMQTQQIQVNNWPSGLYIVHLKDLETQQYIDIKKIMIAN